LASRFAFLVDADTTIATLCHSPSLAPSMVVRRDVEDELLNRSRRGPANLEGCEAVGVQERPPILAD
jgi:hypothetical protein